MADSQAIGALPEVDFGGPEGARTLWSEYHGVDIEYGMLAWKGRRFWFSLGDYDAVHEVVQYLVFELTSEETRVFDDWYAHFRLLSHQWQILANDPTTAGSRALKEKTAQVSAFRALRPCVESAAVARFSVSDHASSGMQSN